MNKKIIKLSGAALLLLTSISSAPIVYAQNQTKPESTQQKVDKKVKIRKYPAMGPGYYTEDAINLFNQMSNPSPFLSLYASPSNQAFLNRIKPLCLADAAQGILPSITAAQAIVETGWGGHILGNNYFGIKGYGSRSNLSGTQECNNGYCYYTHDRFAGYSSMEESFKAHTALLHTKNYANIIGVKDFRRAAYLLQQDRYATSPSYAQTLINVIISNNLTAWDHEAGGSAVASTPVGTVPEPEQIAQIVYKPGYGVLAFQNTGKSIAGSNYKFKDGTRWKVVNTKVINGEEMYLVGNNTYIPKKYTSHYDNGIITIHYQPNYGVNALHADGTQVQGSNKVFKTGTRWNVKYTRVINGEICYLVGNDEYIPKKYTQWGKGE